MNVPKIIKYSNWFEEYQNGKLDSYIENESNWKNDLNHSKVSSCSIIGTLIESNLPESETDILDILVKDDNSEYIVKAIFDTGYIGLTIGDEYYFSGRLTDRHDGNGILFEIEKLVDITMISISK